VYKKWIATAAMLVSTFAFAQSEEEIGRLKVTLTEASWMRFPAAGADIELRSASGKIAGDSALFVLYQANGNIGASIVIGSTRGWSNGVRTTNSCKPRDGLYVYDLSGGTIYIEECARAGGPFPTQGPQLNSMPHMRDALQAQKIQPPEVAYITDIYMMNGRGATVRITALLAPGFAGLPNKVPHAPVPSNFPPAVAAWVDSLAVAAKDALFSFSGAMTVPPVTFVSK
jgi:hypothetical protein